MNRDRQIYHTAVFLFFTIIAFTSCKNEESKSSSEASTKSESKKEEKKEEVKKQNWVSYENTDKMSNKKQFFTETKSTNRVKFKFPYNEPNGSFFTVIIRNMQNGSGNEVIISASKGHFALSFMGNETVRVKFDDNNPYELAYNSAKGGKGDVIFMQSPEEFIKQIKSGKKLMVEADFINHGKEVMEFDIEGLKWDK